MGCGNKHFIFYLFEIKLCICYRRSFPILMEIKKRCFVYPWIRKEIFVSWRCCWNIPGIYIFKLLGKIVLVCTFCIRFVFVPGILFISSKKILLIQAPIDDPNFGGFCNGTMDKIYVGDFDCDGRKDLVCRMNDGEKYQIALTGESTCFYSSSNLGFFWVN